MLVNKNNINKNISLCKRFYHLLHLFTKNNITILIKQSLILLFIKFNIVMNRF